jgi:hypothetical protein
MEFDPENVRLIRAKAAAAGCDFDVIEGDAADTPPG